MTRRPTVRLDRALSKLGLASRADAQALIREGRVRVGSRIVTDPATDVVPERVTIAIDGVKATSRVWRTIAFHKPRGVVTTRRDPDGRPTVFDVLAGAGDSLVAVGRLDLASTGLLLLTNDTRLANWLTDPANRIVRRYVVTVRGRVDDDDARRLEAGIDGLQAARVAVRKRSERETHLVVELTEGRNREIRRLFGAIGREVTRLMRVAYGGIQLGRLQPRAWREIARSEIEAAFPSAPLRRLTRI
jgi:23S rRNA pseudouridine2605 synthase